MVVKLKQDKYSYNTNANELQSYRWQFEQIPLITMLIFSRVNRVGRFTEGTGMSLRQYVFLHLVQRKWTCKSSGWHWQVSLHKAYFTEPVPSSILWMSLFSSKVLSVLYKVTLSAFSKVCSRSAKLMAAVCSLKTLKTNSRIAVGLMFRFSNLDSFSFIIQWCKCKPIICRKSSLTFFSLCQVRTDLRTGRARGQKKQLFCKLGFWRGWQVCKCAVLCGGFLIAP